MFRMLLNHFIFDTLSTIHMFKLARKLLSSYQIYSDIDFYIILES